MDSHKSIEYYYGIVSLGRDDPLKRTIRGK
jgi:hypothetical protein